MKVALLRTDNQDGDEREHIIAKPFPKRPQYRQTGSKSIPFPSINARTQLDETGKLSLAHCKAILCKDGAVYSDEQVALVRQVLYALAEVDYKYHINQKHREPSLHAPPASPIIIPLHTSNTPVSNEQQESYSLHPRIYRRAS